MGCQPSILLGQMVVMFRVTVCVGICAGLVLASVMLSNTIREDSADAVTPFQVAISPDGDYKAKNLRIENTLRLGKVVVRNQADGFWKVAYYGPIASIMWNSAEQLVIIEHESETRHYIRPQVETWDQRWTPEGISIIAAGFVVTVLVGGSLGYGIGLLLNWVRRSQRHDQ